MEEYRISFAYQPNELKRLYQHQVLNPGKLVFWLRLLSLGFPVGILGWLAYNNIRIGGTNVFTLVFSGLAVGYSIFFFYNRIKERKKYFHGDTLSDYRNFTFTPQGFSVEMKGKEASSLWSEFESMETTDLFVFLKFKQKKNQLVLPRRAFTDPELLEMIPNWIMYSNHLTGPK